MSSTPFKLKSGNTTSFKEMGGSPMLHPHDTLREAKSHSKDQAHPKKEELDIDIEVDDMGNPIAEKTTVHEKPKKKEIKKRGGGVVGKKKTKDTPDSGAPDEGTKTS